MTLLEMIWFPVLCIVATTTWIVLAIGNAMRNRRIARHQPSITVQVPDSSDIVHNNGTNLNN